MIETPTNYYLDQTEKLDDRAQALDARGRTLTLLIEETVNELIDNGHTAREVVLVTTDRSRCSWKEFCDLARGFTFYDGHGSSCVNETLRIVGAGGWCLERHEFDGAEWWIYRRPLEQASARAMTARDLGAGNTL